MGTETWRPASSTDGDWLAGTAGSRLSRHDLGLAFPELDWTEVLHPAYRGIGSDVTEVTWGEIAESSGRTVLPDEHFDVVLGMHVNEFENGWRDQRGSWNSPPSQGTLPLPLAERLVRWLSAENCDSTGVLGIWIGWAAVPEMMCPRTPRVDAFGHDYLLFRSPLIDMAATFDDIDHKSANIMYPTDHSWLLFTDPDSWSTFVGVRGPAGGLDQLPGVETRRSDSRP